MSTLQTVFDLMVYAEIFENILVVLNDILCMF